MKKKFTITTALITLSLILCLSTNSLAQGVAINTTGNQNTAIGKN